MKKHLLKTVFLFAGLVFLSSCLKDDPENNSTIYYGHQQIPNINEYMPQELLNAMGNSNLYFGDEPPKIEGAYIADAIVLTDVFRAPGSNWIQTPTSIPTPQYFEFYDQHKGIAKMKYRYPKGTPGQYAYYLEQSSTDTTFAIVSANLSHFTADTIAPVYFSPEFQDAEVFNQVYIMGEDPYFTVYYYEIRDMNQHFQPMNAVIFSGKVDKEIVVETDTVNHTVDSIVRPVIKNAKWGFETMKYYHEGTALSLILSAQYQTLPTKGDVMLLRNSTDLHYGKYHD